MEAVNALFIDSGRNEVFGFGSTKFTEDLFQSGGVKFTLRRFATVHAQKNEEDNAPCFIDFCLANESHIVTSATYGAWCIDTHHMFCEESGIWYNSLHGAFVCENPTNDVQINLLNNCGLGPGQPP